jgi:hypothetical protein
MERLAPRHDRLATHKCAPMWYSVLLLAAMAVRAAKIRGLGKNFVKASKLPSFRHTDGGVVWGRVGSRRVPRGGSRANITEPARFNQTCRKEVRQRRLETSGKGKRTDAEGGNNDDGTWCNADHCCFGVHLAVPAVPGVTIGGSAVESSEAFRPRPRQGKRSPACDCSITALTPAPRSNNVLI